MVPNVVRFDFLKMGYIYNSRILILSSYIFITASFKENEEITAEKDEHEIISQPFNDLSWPQLGEKGMSYNCLRALY